MRLFDYSKLEPGMILAAPVFGRERLLLSEGVTLTKDTIRRLPGWGIYFVLVQWEDKLAA